MPRPPGARESKCREARMHVPFSLSPEPRSRDANRRALFLKSLVFREKRQACGEHSPVASPQVAWSHISSHIVCLASALSPLGETVNE